MNRIDVLMLDPVSDQGFTFEGSTTVPMGPNYGPLLLATIAKVWCNANSDFIDLRCYGEPDKTLEDYFKENEVGVVGISTKTFNILGVYTISALIKKLSEKTLIIVGGNHSTALPEEVLRQCRSIDAVFTGEAELAFKEFLTRYMAGERDPKSLCTGIKGVCFFDGDTFVDGGAPELVENLDRVPDVDYSLAEVENYKLHKNIVTGNRQRRLPIFYGRGCPFKCSFCMAPGKYRMRAPEKVVAEMEKLHAEFDVAHFVLHGSGLYPSTKDEYGVPWYIAFCDKLKESSVFQETTWGYETRIDMATEDLLRRTYAAGCIEVGFGVESGNDEILKKIGKNVTVDQVVEIVELANKVGFPSVRANFIIGLPYETKQTVLDTISLIAKLPIHRGGVGILDIYPGTKVYEMLKGGEGGLSLVGEGGLSWESNRRNDVQVTVNDLTEELLLQYHDIALEILQAKAKYSMAQVKLKQEVELLRSRHTEQVHGLVQKHKDQMARKVGEQKEGLKEFKKRNDERYQKLLKKKDDAYSKLLDKNGRLESTLESRLKHLEELREEKSGIAEVLSKKVKQNKQLNKRLSAKVGVLDKKKVQIENLKNKLDIKAGVLDKKNKQIERLKQKNENLKNKLDSKSDILKQERAKSLNKIKILAEKVRSVKEVRSEFSELKKSSQLLEKQHKLCESEVDKLRKKAEMASSLEKRNEELERLLRLKKEDS